MKKLLVCTLVITSFCFPANAKIMSPQHTNKYYREGDERHFRGPERNEETYQDDQRRRPKRRDRDDKHPQFMKNLSAEQQAQVKQELRRHRAAMRNITGREPRGHRDASEFGENRADGPRKRPFRYHKENNPTRDIRSSRVSQ